MNVNTSASPSNRQKQRKSQNARAKAKETAFNVKMMTSPKRSSKIKKLASPNKKKNGMKMRTEIPRVDDTEFTIDDGNEGFNSPNSPVQHNRSNLNSPATNEQRTTEEEVDVEEDPFLHGMERKTEMFQQLWKGIAQLQHESGDSMQAWKDKLREINQLKNENAAQKQKLRDAREREILLTKKLSSLEDSHAVSSSALQNVLAELEKHKATSTKLLREASTKEKTNEQMVQELSQKLKASEEALNIMKLELDDERRNAEEVTDKLMAVEEKHLELNSTYESEKNNLQANIQLLEGQLSKLSKAKEEASRHLWHVTDEVQKTKQEMEIIQVDKQKLVAELKAERVARAADQELINQKADLSVSELAELRASHVALQSDLERKTKELQIVKEGAQESKRQLQDEVHSLKEDLADRREALSQANIFLEEARKNITDLKTTSNQTIESLRAASTAVQEQQLNESRRCEKEIIDLRNNYSKIQKEFANQNALLNTSKESINQLRSSLDRCKKDLVASNEARQALYVSKQRREETLAKEVKGREILEGKVKEIQLVSQKALQRSLDKLKQAEKRIVELEQEKQHGSKDLQVQFEQSTLSLQVSQDEAKQLSEELLQLRNEMTTRQMSFEDQEKEYQGTIAQLTSKLSGIETCHNDDTDRLRRELNKMKKYNDELELEKRNLIIDCTKLNKEMSKVNDAYNELDAEFDHHKSEHEKLLLVVEELKVEKGDVNKVIQEIKAKMQEEIDEHVNARKESLLKADDLNAEMKQLKKTSANQVGTFRKQIDALQEVNSELQEDMSVVEDALLKKTNELNDKVKHNNELQIRLKQIDSEHAKHTATIISKQEIAEDQLKECNRKRLEAERILNDNSHNYDEMQRHYSEIKTAMKEKDASIAQFERTISQLKSKVEEESEQTRLLKMEIERRKEDYNSRMNDLQVLRSDKASGEREARMREARMNKEMADVRAELSKTESELRSTVQSLKETQHKLEQVQHAGNQTITQLMDEVKNAEAAHAEEAKQLKAELKEQNHLYLDLGNEKEALQKHMDMQQAKLAKDIERLQKRNSTLVNARNDALNDMSSKSDECEALLKDIDNLNTIIAGLERRVVNLEETKNKLESDFSIERKEQLTVKQQTEELENRLRSDIKQLTEECTSSQNELASMKRQAEWTDNETTVRLSSLNRQIANLTSELKRKSDDIHEYDSKVAEAQNETTEIQEAANRVIAGLRDDLKRVSDSAKREIEAARSETRDIVEKTATMDRDFRSMQTEMTALQTELEQCQQLCKERRLTSEETVRKYRELDSIKRKLEIENKRLKLNVSNEDNTMDEVNEAHQAEMLTMQSRLNTLQQTIVDLKKELEISKANEMEATKLVERERDNQSVKAREGRMKDIEAAAQSFFGSSTSGTSASVTTSTESKMFSYASPSKTKAENVTSASYYASEEDFSQLDSHDYYSSSGIQDQEDSSVVPDSYYSGIQDVMDTSATTEEQLPAASASASLSASVNPTIQSTQEFLNARRAKGKAQTQITYVPDLDLDPDEQEDIHSKSVDNLHQESKIPVFRKSSSSLKLPQAKGARNTSSNKRKNSYGLSNSNVPSKLPNVY